MLLFGGVCDVLGCGYVVDKFVLWLGYPVDNLWIT